jgi:hypothetical protein
MNETQLLAEMRQDLQRAPGRVVVYLEGKTDPPVFFALLGVPAPRDDIHRGVLVRGLRDTSSGGDAVRARVEAAARNAGYAGVRGITDGDGESAAVLGASFAPPFAGPAFRWPAYCIENLLVKTGWPAAWGAAPDWTSVLLAHAPYAALNRLHRALRQSLETLRLHRFMHPTLAEPLETAQNVSAALARDKHLLAGYDAEARFAAEVALAETAIRASLDEGHALVNGKWLVDVFAPRALGPSRWDKHRCRSEWLAHATAAGGLGDVRAWWQRLTGQPP